MTKEKSLLRGRNQGSRIGQLFLDPFIPVQLQQNICGTWVTVLYTSHSGTIWYPGIIGYIVATEECFVKFLHPATPGSTSNAFKWLSRGDMDVINANHIFDYGFCVSTKDQMGTSWSLGSESFEQIVAKFHFHAEILNFEQ